AILSSYMIIYGKVAQNQTTLYVDAARVAEVILRAKALALETYDNPGVATSCGYGVRINYAQRSYTLFSYEPAGAPASCGSIATIASANRKTISSFSLNPITTFGPGNNNMYAVLFVPPNPTVLISDASNFRVGSAPGVVYLT